SDWHKTIPNCDGSDGHVETLECWSAVNRYCEALGYESGFGPVEHSGDNLTLVCLPRNVARRFAPTYTQLKTFHPGCDGSREIWGGECSSAVHKYCRSQGANSGFGPVESSGNNTTVVCTY